MSDAEVIRLAAGQDAVVPGSKETIGKTDDLGILQFRFDEQSLPSAKFAVVHRQFAPTVFSLSGGSSDEVSLDPACRLDVTCRDTNGGVVGSGIVDLVGELAGIWAGDIPGSAPSMQVPITNRIRTFASQPLSPDGIASFAPLVAGSYSIGVRHPFMILSEADASRVIDFRASTEINVSVLPVLIVALDRSRYSQLQIKSPRRSSGLAMNPAYRMQLHRVTAELSRRYPRLFMSPFVADGTRVPAKISATAISLEGDIVDMRLRVQRLEDFRGVASDPEYVGDGPRSSGTRLIVQAVDADGKLIDGLRIQLGRDKDSSGGERRGQVIELVTGTEAKVPVGNYWCSVLVRTCGDAFTKQRIELRPDTLNQVDLVAKYPLTQIKIHLADPEPEPEMWNIQLQCDGSHSVRERSKLPAIFWVRRLAPVTIAATRDGDGDAVFETVMSSTEMESKTPTAVLNRK